MTYIVFFILIILISILGTCFDVKPGRLIPLFFLSIISSLYIFGLIGILQLGVYFIFACVFMSFVMFLALMNKRKLRLKDIVTKSLTFPIISYVLLCIFLAWLNTGMLCYNWDEFSHWADVTKTMVYINDFATNPLSHSMFQSYPPGMSLLQYFFEIIHLIHSFSFSEGLLFFVYQAALLSMMLPFLENDKLEKMGKVSMGIATCILPLIFFSNFYSLVYIDPYVAMLAAFGMGLVAFSDKRDIVYDVTVNMVVINLVLAKDIGVYFAIFISIMYAMEKMLSKNGTMRMKTNKSVIRNLAVSFLPLMFMILTKISWNHNINTRNAKKSFSNSVDVLEFLRMFFVGDVESYKQSVVNNARKELFSQRIEVNGFNASYFSIFVAAVAFFVIVIEINKNREKIMNYINAIRIVPFLCVVFYMLTIGAVYAYKFSEYEASNLASYSRYMNIPFLALSLYLIWGEYTLLSESSVNHTIWYTCILCIVLMVTPLTTFHETLTGNTKRYAENFREKYSQLTNKIQNQCDTDDKIWVISRGDRGLDYWVLRFSSRPIWITEGEGEWNLGEAVNEEPQHVDISTEEWLDRLIKGNYTYVAVYNADNEFVDNFGDAFEDASKIDNNTLFYFDNEKRILVSCED